MFLFNLSLLQYDDFMGTQGLYGEEYDRLDFDDMLAALLWRFSGLAGMVSLNEIENLEHFVIDDELNTAWLVGAYTAVSDTFTPDATVYPTQADLNRAMRYGDATAIPSGNLGVVLVPSG